MNKYSEFSHADENRRKLSERMGKLSARCVKHGYTERDAIYKAWCKNEELKRPSYTAYHCDTCGMWHVGSNKKQRGRGWI